MAKMRATVFHGVNDFRVEEVERPRAGPGEAVIRITLTTICGTDLHIVRGEYPVRPGLVIGHEPVGVIADPAQRRGQLQGGRAPGGAQDGETAQRESGPHSLDEPPAGQAVFHQPGHEVADEDG